MIYGEIYNTKENKWDILAVAAKRAVNFEKKILRISENVIVSLPVSGIPYSIQAIWFSGKNHYVVGSGLFRKYDINSIQAWKALHPGITNYHLNDIQANGLNDILICGDFGELLHFNGVTWKSYQESFSGILLGEIAMKDNLFVTVGYSSNKAFIALVHKH